MSVPPNCLSKCRIASKQLTYFVGPDPLAKTAAKGNTTIINPVEK